MKTAVKFLFGLMLLVLGLGAAMLLCLSFTLPPRSQRLAIAGLGAPVSITFDQDGVPRLRAASDVDAATALGFIHARDRMFQMELMRRAASGRIAEIAGSPGLKLDMLMRTLGLRRRAEADYARLPAHTRQMTEAYSRGVNAWIAARGRFAAPEFLALGPPEPWSPVDCLLWGKTMTLYLSGNYRDELARVALARRVRPEQIMGLWPGSPQPQPPQAMALSPALTRLAGLLASDLPAFPAPFTLPRTASNEWAVDGRHSATGAPLLAGDPHLALGLPSFWYLARIDTPNQVLAGATAPGVPFLVVGRNAHLAWTFTTTGTDTQDLFVETQIDAGHYAGPAGVLAYDTHEETIHVRGGPDRVLHVRETRHGPVISDIADGAAEGQVLAVAMAGLAAGDTAPAGLDRLNHARTLDEALASAAAITSPNQNLLAADRHRIGLAVTGRVPIRRAGDGQSPVDGASGAFDWIGFASGEQLPRVVAPASGRLVNGNERVAPADFPVFLGHDWFGDWRARRIRALLDTHSKAAVADFTAMQIDATSGFALQTLPTLLRVRPSTPLGTRSLDLLRGWDGAMTRAAPQPLIFNAWMDRFAIDLLDTAGVPVSQAGPRMEFIAAVLDGRDTAWCAADCSDELSQALERAMADLARTQGHNPAHWQWGRVHQAVFAHPLLARIPILGRMTTRRIAAPGDDATVGRGGMAQGSTTGFDDIHAASYRGVYDLADLDRSRFIMAPGQSGNLLSHHVDDFIRRWRDGQTLALGPTPHYIEAVLTLTPGAP